jgi:hypothetical protein
LPWTVTVRTGGQVQRSRFAELAGALEFVEACVSELVAGAPRRPLDLRYRQFDPGDQVHGRVELAGPERLLPRVHAGVDVRGDGSSAAYVGRVRREPLQRRGPESAVAALRRALA